MVKVTKPTKQSQKKSKKQSKHNKTDRNAKKVEKAASISKPNDKKTSLKNLNRLYSQLLAEHKSNSERLITEILKLLGDQFRVLIRQKHSSRILQACLKYGTEGQRDYIYHKLKGEIAYFSTTSNGSHLLIKAYRYCNAQSKKYFEDNIIFSSNSSLSYLKSRYGIIIWDYIYNKFNITKQINALMHILVSNSVKLLNPTLYDSLLKSKTLDQLHNNLAGSDVFTKYKETCINLFGKLTDKFLTNASVSHDIGYLACLLGSDEGMEDLGSRFTQGLDSLYSTKAGIYVACRLYGYISAKQRKVIVKQLKLNLEEMSTNAVTYLFVCRVLLLTDDTKLTIEHLVKPLAGLSTTLSFDKYGHKVITCIANTHPLTFLNDYEREVINLPSPKSLKDFDLRHSQLYEAFYPLLLEDLIKNQNKLYDWLSNNYSSLVVQSIFKKFDLNLFKAIIKAIEGEFQKSLEILENNTCLHLLQNVVKKLPQDSKEAACNEVWNILEPRLEAVLKSRYVFLLVSLLESLDKSSSIPDSIKNKISREDINSAKSSNTSNCGLELLEKILYN